MTPVCTRTHPPIAAGAHDSRSCAGPVPPLRRTIGSRALRSTPSCGYPLKYSQSEQSSSGASPLNSFNPFNLFNFGCSPATLVLAVASKRTLLTTCWLFTLALLVAANLSAQQVPLHRASLTPGSECPNLVTNRAFQSQRPRVGARHPH